ncbi:trypsin-like serine peptidase [Plantactinospora solaniradicis]|uniref:Trypsin-like serine peptidase n=1 Tax=Plantactinospora solaniradicis TaxID=1723736 RepID=A0ABW1KIY5_9ACTN
MRRGSARTVTVAAGVAITLAMTALPAAATPDEGDTGASPSAVIGTGSLGERQGAFLGRAATAPDGRAATDAAAAEDIREYWTPERMRAATPARRPGPERGAGTGTTGTGAVTPTGKPMRTEPVPPSAEAIAEAARAAGASVTPAAAASAQAGKVFYIDPIDGREHFCSGATVASTKGRLVATAGHCVHNGLWMLGWIFAPGYDNGAPYGTWIAGNLAARTDWIYYARTAADVGVAIMSGPPIVSVVGGNGLAWNQPIGPPVTVVAYPGAINTQATCVGATFTGIEPGHIGMAPCRFAPGGSGGPMLLNYGALGSGRGYLNSVASHIYTNIPNDLYGPYFEDLNAGLFYYAEGLSP